MEGTRQLTTWAAHSHGVALNICAHPVGQGDGHLSNTRHTSSPNPLFLRPPTFYITEFSETYHKRGTYQTKARTSPPTPWRRASLPVMTPLGVDTIAIPMPLRT